MRRNVTRATVETAARRLRPDALLHEWAVAVDDGRPADVQPSAAVVVQFHCEVRPASGRDHLFEPFLQPATTTNGKQRHENVKVACRAPQ